MRENTELTKSEGNFTVSTLPLYKGTCLGQVLALDRSQGKGKDKKINYKGKLFLNKGKDDESPKDKTRSKIR